MKTYLCINLKLNEEQLLNIAKYYNINYDVLLINKKRCDRIWGVLISEYGYNTFYYMSFRVGGVIYDYADAPNILNADEKKIMLNTIPCKMVKHQKTEDIVMCNIIKIDTRDMSIDDLMLFKEMFQSINVDFIQKTDYIWLDIKTQNIVAWIDSKSKNMNIDDLMLFKEMFQSINVDFIQKTDYIWLDIKTQNIVAWIDSKSKNMNISMDYQPASELKILQLKDKKPLPKSWFKNRKKKNPFNTIIKDFNTLINGEE